jgi:glycosyltransferase involved in cell wall biosynthesis
MTPDPRPIRVFFFTLTDTEASEHIYMSSLQKALYNLGIIPVDDWRDADVVHLFEVNLYSRAALHEFEYLKLLRILRSDTPVVVSTDDLYFINRPELLAHPFIYTLNHHTQRWIFRNCDAVIAISETVSQALVQSIPSEMVYIVRHGVDERYRVDNVDNRDDFVLHVSLAAPRKNPEVLVETVRRLDIPFKIAGSGWEEYFAGEPATENAELLGYITEGELIGLYKRASVFYFPTLHEGFGLPILEAMAAGAAVITTNAYAVPEVANGAALLLDPNDVDSHITAIREIFSDDAQRKALAKKGVAHAKGYTWDRTARETKRVYQTVLPG